MDEMLVGDPLDQRLFAASGWELHEEHASPPPPAAAGGVGGATMAPDARAAVTLAHAAASAPEQADGGAAVDGASTWVCPPGQGQLALHVVRRFEFQAALQRNLVVVRPPAAAAGGGGAVTVFVKGSPEALRGLVAPASVPAGARLAARALCAAAV